MIPTSHEYHRLALTLSWIEDNITYKPGTRIRFKNNFDHIDLIFESLVPDCSKPRFPKVDNTSGYMLGPREQFITAQEGVVTSLFRAIERAIDRHERHERMEFLRVRNVHLSDPHPDEPGTQVVLEPFLPPWPPGEDIEPEVLIFTGVKARTA